MDVDSITYAERLMPDFEVFDIIERDIIKDASIIFTDNLGLESTNELFYFKLIVNKDPKTEEKVTISDWSRIALRSTRELKIDWDRQEDSNFSFIEIPNYSDETPDYFYYIIISDTDYVERSQDNAEVHLKYSPGEDKITEIVGVVV